VSTTMIVFELTGGYALSIALLLSVSIATGLHLAVHGRSFFHYQLETRGVVLAEGPHRYFLKTVKVASFMTPLAEPETPAEGDERPRVRVSGRIVLKRGQGKLIWLQGLICVELEQLDRAEEHLREVVEVFQAINQPGETALVTTDLVRVLLKRGRRLEAHQTAQTMLPLLAPRRSNQILSGAIADLLRHGTAGLTLELVERVRAQIEKQGGALSAPK